ncbi:hypothetical protein LXL04_036249 [Taraxacum kok-saghyz]
MATATSSDPVMKSEGSASGGETSEAASTIGMAAAAAVVVKGNNYQQQLMVKYKGIKKSKKDRGCTAKERISKMPPCAAGKRSSIYRGVTRHRWTGRYEAHLWDKSTWNQNQNKKGKQGAYDDEEAAARAYDLAALKYWGPGTLINFPVTDYTRDLEEMQNLTREDYLASLRRKGSGFSRGNSKCRGISSTRWDSPLGRGPDYDNRMHHGDETPTENEYVGGFRMDRKIDLTPYIKWWAPTKSRQAAEKSSDETNTNHASSEDTGTDKTPEWVTQPTEPYQLPRLGVMTSSSSSSTEPKQQKRLSVSAMSILSRSTAYKSLQEKALKKEEKEKEIENDENENKNNINKIDYGKGVEKLGNDGTSEFALGMEPLHSLTTFLSAPLLTSYNAIDPLVDPGLWSTLRSSQPLEATKIETGSDYSFFQEEDFLSINIDWRKELKIVTDLRDFSLFRCAYLSPHCVLPTCSCLLICLPAFACLFAFVCLSVSCLIMTSDKEKTSGSGNNNNNRSGLNLDDPLIVHSNDLSCVSIVNFKLQGTINYKAWSSATELGLRARNKLGFVTGTIPRPTEDELKMSQWDRADVVVLSWILASISENLYASGDTISDYYNKLNSLWKEFDSLSDLQKCTCDANKSFSDHSHQIKLMQFLTGLDDSFSQVRSNILLREPLPNVKTAFAICSREESYKSSSESSSKTPNSAFFGKTNDNKKRFSNNNNSNNNNKSFLVCKNCGIKGHTIERCFKLIGYPKDHKGKNDNQSKSFSSNNSMSDTTAPDSPRRDNKDNNAFSSTTGQNHTFSPDQISKILSLISDKSIFNPVANMAGVSFSVQHNNIEWVIDSGANQHYTTSDKNLDNVIDISYLKLKVDHPNGTSANILKVGNLSLLDSVGLFDELVVPEFNINLMSVHKVVKDNRLRIIFDENECIFQDSLKRMIVGTSKEKEGLYVYNQGIHNKCCGKSNLACCTSKATWHSRLGHPSEPVLKVLKQTLALNDQSLPPCDICHRSKQTRDHFPLSEHKSTSLGDLVHVDVWGPYRTATYKGFKYFLTIVDDYTRSCWIYLLKTKSEVYENFLKFSNLLKTQYNKTVKVFRSDNGTEFVNKIFSNYFEKNGIINQTTCVYTPQQNGIVDRKHRHLLNVARSLLFQSGIALKYWGDAVLTASYLINRTPSSVLKGRTPYDMIYNTAPLLNHLRVFGDVRFYEHIMPFKMSAHDKDYSQHIEFCDNSLTHDLVNPNDDNIKQFFENLDNDVGSVSRDASVGSDSFNSRTDTDNVIRADTLNESGNNTVHSTVEPEHVLEFNDNLLHFNNADSDGSHERTSGPSPSSGSRTSSGLRRSSRETRIPKSLEDYVLDPKLKYNVNFVVSYAHLDSDSFCFAADLNKTIEPKTFQEACTDSHWINAMNEEMEALYRNQTWILTDLPEGRKPIGCKWVFKIKYKQTGEIDRYKAHLVAKGYSQKEGIDFDETFSHVAKMTTVRCLISLDINFGWNLYQLDVNNAFLYDTLEEEVYMSLPLGCFSKGDNKVCKLVKPLYGLKQAPRNSIDEIDRVKSFLNSKFKIKDLGILIFFLGIETVKTKTGVCLCQRKYTLELLHEYGLIGCKPSYTPLDLYTVINDQGIDENDEIRGVNEPSRARIPPSSARARLSCCRLELELGSFKVWYPSSSSAREKCKKLELDSARLFMHSPMKSHVRLAMRVLRYLKLNPGKGISIIKSQNMKLTGHVDADWAKCLSTRRSVTGYCLFLGDSLISWKSKKQPTVSRSSTESEYRALAIVTTEIMWVMKLLWDLNVKCEPPISVLVDNKSAIQLALNPVFHERTKHIEVDVHFVRDRVSDGTIKVVKTDTTEQIADIFTKSLGRAQHEYLLGQEHYGLKEEWAWTSAEDCL